MARAAGNLDDLVSVLSRDMSSSDDYAKIAEECLSAGRHDQALEWAEKGLEASPFDRYGRLRELAANACHRLGRHEEADAMARELFRAVRSVDAY